MARGLPFGSDERIAVFRSLFAKLPLFEPYECHDPMREIAPGSWLLFERVAFGGRVPRLYETISLGGNIDDFDEVAKLLGVDKSFVYAQCEWKDDGPLPASPRVSDDLGTAMALVSTIFALVLALAWDCDGIGHWG